MSNTTNTTNTRPAGIVALALVKALDKRIRNEDLKATIVREFAAELEHARAELRREGEAR